jgi:K+-sensing histidine kinase KdpD
LRYILQLLPIDDDERISKHSVGIGMGLSVCKAIASKMGAQNMNTIFV